MTLGLAKGIINYFCLVSFALANKVSLPLYLFAHLSVRPSKIFQVDKHKNKLLGWPSGSLSDNTSESKPTGQKENY